MTVSGVMKVYAIHMEKMVFFCPRACPAVILRTSSDEEYLLPTYLPMANWKIHEANDIRPIIRRMFNERVV